MTREVQCLSPLHNAHMQPCLVPSICTHTHTLQHPRTHPIGGTDVDGTLIHSIGKEANRLHKECFTAGFKDVFGLDTNIDVVEHHGSTDPLIVLKVCVCVTMGVCGWCRRVD